MIIIPNNNNNNNNNKNKYLFRKENAKVTSFYKSGIVF